ncbi:MAG TPA: YbjN domain-containing protein [Propionibacteriaceae bacterium]|nr:YbjN domain-containing protein [Propionibacteriaceae bacterium]
MSRRRVEFDLDRATADAWAQFTARLAVVLSMIDAGGRLHLGTQSSADDAAPAVDVSCERRGDEPWLRLTTPGNHALGRTFQLGPVQVQALHDLGWHDDGEDFSIEHVQDDCSWLAGLVVATVRDVFGVQHPVFLAPDQLAEVLQPDLGSSVDEELADEGLLVGHEGPDAGLPAMVDGGEARWRRLQAQVLAELTDVFGHEPFRDRQGDIAIRVGSTVVFVRVTPDAEEVIIFSVLVHDVDGRSRAMEILNDLNAESRFGRFALHRDKVFVSMSLLADPFVPAHLRTALAIMSRIADGIDDDLARKLRGRTTFDQSSGSPDPQ